MQEPIIITAANGCTATLYCGDCLEVLPTLGKVDAVVMDPPYGIGWEGHSGSKRDWSAIRGDDGSLDLRSILSMNCRVIAFGANCYPEQLPHRGRWICWDKRTADGAADAMLGSPFELAWINRTSGFDRIIRVLHGGVVNADGAGRSRFHPTQKPVEVMRRIIEMECDDSIKIFDPFMGSGTTGVAALKLGRNFVGIEIEPKYFDIARRRIEAAASVIQQPLFAVAPRPVAR